VNVAGGTVRQLNWLMVAGKRPAGQWCATAASGTSSASVTGLNGTFKLSGTTESFKPETIRANGSGRVNIPVAQSQPQTSNWLEVAGRVRDCNWHPAGADYRSYLTIAGRLNGRFNLSGSLAAIHLKQYRAMAAASANS